MPDVCHKDITLGNIHCLRYTCLRFYTAQ